LGVFFSLFSSLFFFACFSLSAAAFSLLLLPSKTALNTDGVGRKMKSEKKGRKTRCSKRLRWVGTSVEKYLLNDH
jgi:hypothetical protein